MQCEFCNLGKNEKNVLLETKHWKVVLSSNQSHLGYCIVFLKKHCEDLALLKNDEQQDFFGIVEKLESALKKSFNATMFNWACLMNNAYQNSPPNPHVHWHFRPRYSSQVNFAGEIFEDKEFGHHYNIDNKKDVSKEIEQKIFNAIKQNL